MARKKTFNIIVIFFLYAIIGSFTIGFYLSYYLKNFSRFLITIKAGLLAGILLSIITYFAYKLLDKYENSSIKGHENLVILSVATLLAGVSVELVIYRQGLSHYSWILGALATSVLIGLALDTHTKLQDLIDESIGSLESIYQQVIMSLNSSLETIEPYNRGHYERVALYSLETAKILNIEESRYQNIIRAGLLHDLGKIGVSEKILLKEGELDRSEWKTIRRHPGIAGQILKPLRNFSEVVRIIQYHHERADGKGYKKIPGSKIPLEARIIAVTEAFDTMITEKPYGKTFSVEEALKEIENEIGSQFDGDVVEAFSSYIRKSGDFTPPDYLEIRKEFKLNDSDIMEDPTEDLHKAAGRLAKLKFFYQMMGLRKNHILSLVYVTMVSGIVMGSIIGFSVYSLSSDIRQVLSFILQGFVVGFTFISIGYLTDMLLMSIIKKRGGFLKSPFGRALVFFPAGLLGGYLSLILVVRHFNPGAVETMNSWNTAYVFITGALATGVSYFSHQFRRISSILLINLQGIQKLYFELIYSLSYALEAKDPYTRGHTERVAAYCGIIAEQFGLDKSEREDLRLAALFHDIGKIGVKLSVLHKSSKLEEAEFDIIRQHPGIGADMIEPLGVFSHIAPYVRHHHENWDGSGYPYGLSGDKIPLFARIISVADAFDALVTDRPYKEGFTWEASVDILKNDAGKRYDPKVVEIFIDALDNIDPSEIDDSNYFTDMQGMFQSETHEV